ncbi:DMT family transporter [Kribbella sp. NPDC056861]|uniref:DMT family transporter n=1 Tax=Kribbella sp. NPDC056861 TaxID=3154857 RepID=UPI003424C4D6
MPADHPLYGATIRALPAGLLLMLVCRRLPTGAWWWRSVVLGVLNMSAFFALVYVAAQLLPASVASVVMATSSVTMMLIAWALISERPGLLPAVGAALGIAGVGTMLLTGAESIKLAGVAASIAAMVMSSLGYVLTKKWGASTVGRVPVLASTAWQLVAGGLLLVPVAVLVEGAPPALDAAAIAGFAYVSIIATAVAFVAWFTGLRHLPAATVGLIGLLNPVTGVLLGTGLAGEALTGRQVIGIVLVLGGVALGRSIRRPRILIPSLLKTVRKLGRIDGQRHPRGREIGEPSRLSALPERHRRGADGRRDQHRDRVVAPDSARCTG